MAAEIIDGKQVAEEIRMSLKNEIHSLARKGIIPGLAVILVGDDPASLSYVTGKEKACADLGMKSFDFRLPSDSKEEDLLRIIADCNGDPDIHGILVQLPLPKHLSERNVIAAISPDKDVDGFTPINVGRMVLGEDCFLPCTPHGVIKLLESRKVPLKGAKTVIVGRSNIVGKPLMNLLVRKEYNATVTVCHTGTKDLAAAVRDADIVIACAGQPGLVTGSMVKPGAVVIDVGVNRVEDPSAPRGYRLKGDCDFESVAKTASLVTPVPGGVGPMTITMLLFNTVKSATRFLLSK